MACNCPPDSTPPPPREPRTRYEVLSGGQVVYRSYDQGQADTVAARWPDATVRPVDGNAPWR